MTSFDSQPISRRRALGAIPVIAALTVAIMLLINGDASALAAPPYPGPTAVALPGVIEAENYDTGGQGVSYNDTDTANVGGQYRTDAVDIWATYREPGSYTVGRTRAGEWLTYSVTIAEAGTYSISPRVASGSPDPSGLGFYLNARTPDEDYLGGLTVGSTGGWWNWLTPAIDVDLPAGNHELSVTWLGSAKINLDRITITRVPTDGAEGPYPGPGAAAVPGAIEAENYDIGGQGVSYSDVETTNIGGQYRSDGVDIWSTYREPGGHTLGRTRGGEWLRYTINVAETGTYTLSPRVASGFGSPGGLRFSLNDGTAQAAELGSLNVDNTGGWWNWQNPELDGLTLPAGQHTLRMTITGNGYINVDKLNLRRIVDDPTNGSSIEVWARGDEGGETYELQIDGRTVETRTVTTQLVRYIERADSIVAADSVRVVFINDLYDRSQGIDRNLFVDKITIDNVPFETEDDSVYSTGVWRREDGIQPGYGRGEKLAANGYFQYASSAVGPTPIPEPPTPIPEPPTPIPEPPTPIPEPPTPIPEPTPITSISLDLSDIEDDPDDNVADNVQAALDALDAAGGTVTVETDGDYPWRSKVKVKSNQRLVIDGDIEFEVRQSLDHVIEFDKGTETEITEAVVDGGTWDSNAMVSGGMFDISGAADGVVVQNATFRNTGGESASGGLRGIAIDINGVGDATGMIRIADNTFSDFFHMVNAKDVTGLYIEDNSFWNLLDTLPVSSIVNTQVTDADGVLIRDDAGNPQPLRYLAGANGGSFVYLDGSTHHVSIHNNSNPGGGLWAYRTTEVGGHVVNGVPRQPHTHLSITDNHFISVPGEGWSTVQPNPYRAPTAAEPDRIVTPPKAPVPNGASGDVITVRNVEYFEVRNNRVDTSGEFSITVVRGSSKGIVEGNEVFDGDGGAIVIGATSNPNDPNLQVSDVEIRDNLIRNVGLDNAGDLQSYPSEDRRGLQANYPNTRTGVRVWNADRINVVDNDIGYNSSGVWVKVTDFNAGTPFDMNRVGSIYIPLSGVDRNSFVPSAGVWRGKSVVRDALGNELDPRQVDAAVDPSVHQIVPKPELGLFDAAPAPHTIPTSPFLAPDFAWLN